MGREVSACVVSVAGSRNRISQNLEMRGIVKPNKQLGIVMFIGVNPVGLGGSRPPDFGQGVWGVAGGVVDGS